MYPLQNTGSTHAIQSLRIHSSISGSGCHSSNILLWQEKLRSALVEIIKPVIARRLKETFHCGYRLKSWVSIVKKQTYTLIQLTLIGQRVVIVSTIVTSSFFYYQQISCYRIILHYSFSSFLNFLQHPQLISMISKPA